MDYSNGKVRLKTKKYPIWWNGTMAKHVMEKLIKNDGHHNLDHEDIQQSLQTRKEIHKKSNKNKYIALNLHSDGVYWTFFSFSKKFAVILTNYKMGNTIKQARKQLPKSVKKISNPSNENGLALAVPKPILEDWKELVEMGEFDSVEELKEMHEKVVRKFQIRN